MWRRQQVRAVGGYVTRRSGGLARCLPVGVGKGPLGRGPGAALCPLGGRMRLPMVCVHWVPLDPLIPLAPSLTPEAPGARAAAPARAPAPARCRLKTGRGALCEGTRGRGAVWSGASGHPVPGHSVRYLGTSSRAPRMGLVVCLPQQWQGAGLLQQRCGNFPVRASEP